MRMHTQRHWMAIALLVFLGTLVAAASASHPAALGAQPAAAAPAPAAVATATLPASDPSVPAAAGVFSASSAGAAPEAPAPTF